MTFSGIGKDIEKKGERPHVSFCQDCCRLAGGFFVWEYLSTPWGKNAKKSLENQEYTLSPIIMEVENGGLEDDWLVSFWGPFSTSMIRGGRVDWSMRFFVVALNFLDILGVRFFAVPLGDFFTFR